MGDRGFDGVDDSGSIGTAGPFETQYTLGGVDDSGSMGTAGPFEMQYTLGGVDDSGSMGTARPFKMQQYTNPVDAAYAYMYGSQTFESPPPRTPEVPMAVVAAAGASPTDEQCCEEFNTIIDEMNGLLTHFDFGAVPVPVLMKLDCPGDVNNEGIDDAFAQWFSDLGEYVTSLDIMVGGGRRNEQMGGGVKENLYKLMGILSKFIRRTIVCNLLVNLYIR